MFKALILLIFFTFFFISASADFFLVSPVEQKLLDGGFADLGVVSRGETFEIVISDESSLGQDVRWQRFFSNPDSLPNNWFAEKSVEGEKRLLLKVTVPKTAPTNIYVLKVTALNDEFGLQEEFTAQVRVKDDLMQTAVNNPGLNQFPFAQEKVIYKIVIRNDSIAPHSVRIFSTLPKDWFNEIETEILPKQTATLNFEVTPLVEGKKDFKIKVFSKNTQKEISAFDFSLGVRPTLFGKLSAPKNGLAFFSFSLMPFYFFDSLIFSLFN